METIKVIPGQALWLGYQGENNARAVVFDFSAWKAEYGDGVLTLAYIPPDHETAYPMEVLTTGTMGTWALTSAVTQYAGYGWALWSYRRAEDGLVVKTCKNLTTITASPEDAGGGDPAEPWVEQVLNAGAAAQAAAQAAAEAAERAEASLDKLPYPDLETETWWRYNSETGEYEDTGASYGGGGGSLPSGGTAGQVLTKRSGTAGDAAWEDLPTYDGTYQVAPLVGAQTTMNTAQTYLDRDIVVKPVGVYAVENDKGGNTVTIGG